ncbi:MAG: dipeptidyl aminopeptidase/acylaminoacyl peptidase [Paraglaciecola sp.]|jgi:dipeptidyl aminopeptidase/acylaminoacyl peptidase
MRTIFSFLLLGFSVFSIDLPASPIPAEKLFKNSESSMLKFSPNGKYISIFTTDNETRLIYLFNIESGETLNIITFNSDQSLYDYDWINDETIILKVTSRGASSKFIVKLEKHDGIVEAKSTHLRLKGDIVGFLPEQENIVLFSQKSKSSQGDTLYYASVDDLLNNTLKKARKIPNLHSSKATYVYDDQAAKLISIVFDETLETVQFHYKPLASGEWEPLFSSKIVDFSFLPVGFLKNKNLAVLSNKNTDKMALHEFDIATQTFTKILIEHEKYDLSDATISAETGEVESIRYFDHGRYTTQYFGENQKQEAQLIRDTFPDKQFLITAVNRETDRKILLTVAAEDPGTYYLFDRQALTAEQLVRKLPDLLPYKMNKTERITVESDDGSQIEAFLTKPDGFNQNVLLVMPHGGPIGVREYDLFNPTVQYLSSRGFSVLRVNFRGSTGYGKRFQNEGVAQLGKIIEQDITRVLDEVLVNNHYEKTCAMGASYGGFSSFLLAIKHPDSYDCIVASYGLYDLPLWFNGSNIDVFDEDYRRRVANTIGEMNEDLFEVSPVYLADKVTVPVLLIAGKDDDVTGFEHSNRMEYALKKHQKIVETLNYADTGHGHTNWWGEWHEIAYVHDYLLRTLDLKPYEIDKIPEADQKLIGAEMARLADSFNFKSKLENDDELAWAFYKKAADYNHPRSMHNVASFYLSGKKVDRDVEQAIALFKQSSDLSYGGASYELGELYYTGKGGEQDYTLSLNMFELAKEQEYNSSVNIKIARALCLGRGIDKSVAECVKLLKLEDNTQDKLPKNAVTDATYATRKSVLFDIIINGQFTAQELSLVHSTIASEFDIQIYPISISERDFGKYFEKSYNSYDYEEFDHLAALPSETFGVDFDVVPDAMFADNGKLTGVIVRWLKHSANGVSETAYQSFLYGARNNWSARYKLAENELQSALWELEVYDLFGNKLHHRTFNIVAKEKSLLL